MYFLTRLRSKVRSREVIYKLNSDYTLVTLKVFSSMCIFLCFYDKKVYFFHNECVDSSKPH